MREMPKHLTDEQLVELYYEPQPNAHLDTCSDCRAQFGEMQATLNAFNDLPIPDAPAFTWRPPLSYRLLRWRPLLFVPAFAAALAMAFFVGRATKPQRAIPAAIQLAQSGRERIMLVALGDHLERSQMVLLELANGDGATFPESQQRARNLLGENRLYHQTTLYAGDRNYTELLEELDRVLTAVANEQSQSSRPNANQIEQLLFKVRVTNSNLRKGTETL